MRRKLTAALTAALALGLAAALAALYWLGVIPHRKYSNADFGIETYVSPHDADADGVNDQADILQSVRAYLAARPRYESAYYAGGYPDDGRGVCTDVVAFGLLGAGYDLRELVMEDIKAHREDYDIPVLDKDIDFRRVSNLRVYFEHTAVSLTTDLSDIAAWQGGDIVVFEKHIGVVSDSRNARGVPFLLHHGSASQIRYEEDVLERRGDIVAHYRVG